MQSYKKLKVWEKAHWLTIEIYKHSGLFPREETYGLVNQIRRSAASIPTNIAEGCGRWTKADTAQFFQISLGSSNEVDYQLLLAKDLGYLQVEIFNKLETEIGEIRAMLIGLISKIRTN